MEKVKVKIEYRNLMLLCVIVLTVSIMTAAGRAEPNQPEPNHTEPNQMSAKQAEPNQPEDDESIILELQDSNTMSVNGQPRGTVEVSSVDQPVQSISFRPDASVRDVLRFLAIKYRKNIIPSAKVDGKVNITNLYEVTFREALDAVLGHGFYYEFGDNFVKIYTKEEYDEIAKDRSRMTSRAYTLYYVNASEIKALITPVLSDVGKIGTTTAAGTSTAAGESGDKLTMRDTIVVYDYPEKLDLIGRMIKEIDVKPQQIMIEVTVLNAKLTETTEFGINWNTISGVTVTQFTNGISMGLTSGITPSGTGLNVGFTNDKFVSLITALEGVIDVTVLANPKIMALNKQVGHIKIGDETGYLDSTTQNQIGTTQSVAFLETGTLLSFRPFICDDGYVRMEINPEESSASLREEGSGNNITKIPSKSVTQVKTNIMVKDGRTIIIGGLFKEDLTNTNSQVPVAGDLPIVGALFKRTKNVNIRTEIIILITPHIINEPQELASESEKKQRDVNRLYQGSRKAISPISRIRIYEDNYARAVKYYSEKEYNKALAELNWIIGFRPDVLEAVQLKEKILVETRPGGYSTLERIMIDKIRKEQDGKWKRK